jgi:hypothetical protein
MEVNENIIPQSGKVEDEYVRIGFRATPDQRMENVNEVRCLLRDLYKPQQVIFSQTILK